MSILKAEMGVKKVEGASVPYTFMEPPYSPQLSISELFCCCR